MRGSGSPFAYIKWYTSEPLFHGRSRRITERGVVEAADADSAVEQIVGRSSVAAIRAGMTIQVVPVDFSTGLTAYASYTDEPLNENHSANPNAKLVIGPLL